MGGGMDVMPDLVPEVLGTLDALLGVVDDGVDEAHLSSPSKPMPSVLVSWTAWLASGPPNSSPAKTGCPSALTACSSASTSSASTSSASTSAGSAASAGSAG